jgi:hypothetical protein
MKTIKNKTLLILFLILAVIAVIMFLYDRNKGERSFKSELFTVDSSKVTAISVYPKGKTNASLRLVKTGKTWEIKSKKNTYPADSLIIQRIIGALCNVKPERVAGTGKSNWKNLEITDSLGTHVIVEQGKEVIADLWIGKISISQDNNRPSYGRNQNISIKSNVRVAGDDRVYVVDGFLSMMFGDQPSMYRNRTVFRIDKNMLTRLTFVYPGDSSFMLVKNGSHWLLNDQPVDSAKTENYLNSIRNTVNSEFADEGTQPFIFPYTLKIEGNDMTAIEVQGAINPDPKKYFIKSTFNPSAIFGSSNANLFNQVFPGKDKFSVSTEKVKKEIKKKKAKISSQKSL